MEAHMPAQRRGGCASPIIREVRVKHFGPVRTLKLLRAAAVLIPGCALEKYLCECQHMYMRVLIAALSQ